jgi:hypothetical protein
MFCPHLATPCSVDGHVEWPEKLSGLILVASAMPGPMHRPPKVMEGMVGVMNSAALIQQTIDNTLTAKRLSAEVNAQVVEDGLRGSPEDEAPHTAIAKSVQRRSVKVIANHGEIAMPTISAHTYKLSIQVPESWMIPSAPRMSTSAMDVAWSLNSDVIAAMRTPPRSNKGLISTRSPNLFR